jgi:FkbM family methyltransferase
MAQTAYGGYDGVFWENCAVSDTTGEADLYYVKEVPQDKHYLIGVASFNREHILKHGVESTNIDSKLVSTFTLSELIKKYKLSNIDLLVIDIEGHEFKALSSIDYSFFKPKLVVIETAHMNIEEFKKILQLFPANNYRGVYSKEFQDSVIYRVE